MNRALPALVFVAMLASSGCLDAGAPGNGGGPENDEDPLVLADFAGCDGLTWPNGSPVDCDRDDARIAVGDPPANWVCYWDTTDPGGEWVVRLLTDGDGRYGVHVVPTTDREGVAVGGLNLTTTEGHRYLLFRTRMEDGGFVTWPEPFDDRPEGEYHLDLYHVSKIEGSPDVLSRENFELRNVMRRGVPWYVASFSGEETYYFPGSTPQAHPSTRWEGQDFTLEMLSTVMANNSGIINNPGCVWNVPPPT